jgi:hypothetical protein
MRPFYIAIRETAGLEKPQVPKVDVK